MNFLHRSWEGITVDYGQMFETGEFDAAMPQEGIAIAFAPHDKVVWSIDGDKPQTTSLAAGIVFIYASRQLVWHHRDKPSEWIHITFDPKFVSRVALENGLPESTQIQHQAFFVDSTILHIAQLLREEVLNEGLAGSLFVESLRNLLVIHLLRHHKEIVQTIDLKETRLSLSQLHRVKEYIEEHLAEDLSIANLATIALMSEFHFARAFKATIGESPHRYVIQRRIERSKVLLSVTQLSISEIAYRVGITNQSHFTAQFRKLVGTTPKQYRDSA
jgi:AraC family transcriptional regulator